MIRTLPAPQGSSQFGWILAFQLPRGQHLALLNLIMCLCTLGVGPREESTDICPPCLLVPRPVLPCPLLVLAHQMSIITTVSVLRIIPSFSLLLGPAFSKSVPWLLAAHYVRCHFEVLAMISWLLAHRSFSGRPRVSR